jgi:16S rRNA (uracil1498-N3)-methyltransferase
MNRLLVPGATPGEVRVTGPRAHKLVHVLRSQVGDTLEVFDGAGATFEATLVEVGAEAVLLTLGEARRAAAQRAIAVVQALPKGAKLEWMLEKATELGASAFWPVVSERTVVKLSGREPAKLARWQRVVDEAARQCGRAEVPVVHPPQALLPVARSLATTATVLVLDEEERAVRLSDPAAQGPLAVVVGPEGGLSRGEVAALASSGAVPVTLGAAVLRTETAALAALVVLRHLEGALG